MYWSHILKLFRLTNSKQKSSLYLIFLLVLLSSISEVFTLSAVIPFVSILIDPEFILSNENNMKLFFFFNTLDSKNLKFFLLIIFILLIIISCIIRLLLAYLINRSGYLIGADLTQLIYSTSISQSYEFHLDSNSSKMINILVSKINSSIQSTIIPFIMIVANLVLMLFIISALIFIEPISSLKIILALVSIYLIISNFTNKILTYNGKTISREHERVMRLLKESSSGIREVILNHIQTLFIDLYRKSDFLLRKSQAINSFIASSPRFLVEMFAIIILILIAYFLTNNKNFDINPIAYIALLGLAAQRLLPVLQQIYLSWASIQGAKANVEDMLDFFDSMTKYDIKSKKKIPIKFKKSIEFKDVSFNFSNNKPVIKNINFKIFKGEKVGIVGKTGSGKSTILNLLLGLVEPSSGEILIDSTKLIRSQIESWQTKVSSVSQNMFFLDGSIKKNIIFNFTNKKFSKKKLNESIKIADIENIINKNEYGLDTSIGESGSKLSGGQKQRIALARALYKDHELLIFDEATSALDKETESKIMNSVYGLDKITLIIVSHRLQSLKGCNKIIKIEEGTISKIGTYNEVIAKN